MRGIHALHGHPKIVLENFQERTEKFSRENGHCQPNVISSFDGPKFRTDHALSLFE
jgi:hypothetical protein